MTKFFVWILKINQHNFEVLGGENDYCGDQNHYFGDENNYFGDQNDYLGDENGWLVIKIRK